MKSSLDHKQVDAFLFTFNYMQAPWRLENDQRASWSLSGDKARVEQGASIRLVSDADAREKSGRKRA